MRVIQQDSSRAHLPSVPIKVWADPVEVESAAITQLRNVASLPGVFRHVAVMPDVHLGKGATVGSVIATAGMVIPAAVGVDIGCGMAAVETHLDADVVTPYLGNLFKAIEAAVPVGFAQHKERNEWEGMKYFYALSPKVLGLRDKVQKQLGTLGGGNHFIELCVDERQKVWVMLHSGSRHIGKSLADVHINSAKGLMKQYLISLPDPDLAYLVEGSSEFDAYMRDLLWAQEYAKENRRLMLKAVLQELVRHVGQFSVGLQVNCHHNYVEKEHHFGKNVLVTRKGAVRARETDYGIIPGSMGTKSYIVKGKGNPESFHSCSHGAGRRMSRTKAKVSFAVEDLQKQTEGVVCRKDAGVLDEIPGAYKDIDTVMANQQDLVEIVATLKQILCVKG